MDHHDDLKVSTMKAVVAWISVLASSALETWTAIPWDKLAQFAAFIYTTCLIIQFIWRRVKEGGGTQSVTK